MVRVSAIIPVYNAQEFLAGAVESILCQTFQDFEILIVDDGSTDNTKYIAGDYAQKYGEKIRYIYQDNQGLAAARNAGLRNCRGEYVALLDADDEWLPERLAEGVRTLDENPSIGLVHSNSMRISETGEVIRINKRKPALLSGWIFKGLFLRKAEVSCPTVLFRKECVERVGNFDEKLSRLGCEDRELWLRIAQQYPFMYIDRVLARYRVRGSSMSKDTFKMLKARYYVINKFTADKKISFLRQSALQQVHKELGDELLIAGQYIQARGEYLKALRFWPFSFWAWFNLIKTFCYIPR